MTDLIKREDATETFAELYDIFDDYPNIVKELHKVYDKILAIPTVEPKTGEWLYTNNPLRLDDEWACSRCGNVSFVRTNFCDRCGADMRKGANNE